MILDMFSELQKPDGMPEPQLYVEALAQAKLADEMGFGCWWSVEHHCTGHFSYCSTPEMMLTLISQHTEQIHLGHSGVLAPYGIHHPLQVAERAAFLDVISGGRLELGLARSVAREWETFRIDVGETRDQVDEALRIIPRMWTEKRFSHEGQVSIPERDVVPKPIQRPHPPLWVTTVNPAGFERAGRFGVGVLGTVLLSPVDSLATLFAHYQRGLDECDPAGAFVNDQKAVFAFFHCAESRREAIESRAAEATLWFMNIMPEVYSVRRKDWLEMLGRRAALFDNRGKILASGESQPHVDLDFDHPVPLIALMNRQLTGQKLDPVEAYEVLEPIDAAIIGDVETCRKKLQRFAEIGVDRLMCLMQMAPLPHDVVMRSIRTAGKYLIPEL